MSDNHHGFPGNISLDFDKHYRLLTASDYSRVFDQVDCKVSNRNILLLAAFNSGNTARLGLVVSKKNAKLAVQRNRIKRVARESFRLQRQQLPAIDIVLLTKRGVSELTKEQLHTELNKLWIALGKRADKSSKA